MDDKKLPEPISDCSEEKKVCINEDVIETVKDNTEDYPSPDITEQPLNETSKNI